MAEKKRKDAASVPAAAPPAKKSKKSTVSKPAPTTEAKVNEVASTAPTTNEAVAKSKNGRKRASDFLGDDEETAITAPAVSAKSSKKTKKSTSKDIATPKDDVVSLTADGTNGIVEHSDDAEVEIATSKKPSNTSLEAEGLRTADNELDEEDASEDDDQGAALLAGFDSDTEDVAEDQGDLSKTQPIPQFKKTSKKLRQAQEKGSEGPGAVYVGRIPHGFYEQQMRDYFEQFGDITRLRLSRNKRTGASKHFAFIEFGSDEVAKIVAETMDNYLMFGHILKCKYAPSENLHPDVWKGANKKYRKIPYDKLQRQQLEAPKTQEQWVKKNEKERQKRVKQAEKMKAIGYEYTVPELKDPSALVERKKQQEHGIPPAALTDEEQPDAVAAPPAVPADEIALKKEKKSKKSKSADVYERLTQGNLDAMNAGPEAESAKISQNEEDKANDVATADITPGMISKAVHKKPKKSKKGGSILEESSNNQYDTLSSIGVGIEAAPAYVTDAMPQSQQEAPESILTHAGVADAVLAGRKSDRKKAAKPSKSRKNTDEKAEAQVETIALGAVKRGRKEKEKGKEREKEKLKGILKKAKKA